MLLETSIRKELRVKVLQKKGREKTGHKEQQANMKKLYRQKYRNTDVKFLQGDKGKGMFNETTYIKDNIQNMLSGKKAMKN